MCHKCDTKLPTKFSYSGPHIKEICGECNAYIKFANKVSVPPFQESKNRIWATTNNLALIEEEKTKMGVFHKDLKGIHANISYHNLYVNILKRYSTNITQPTNGEQNT